jgi:hypothetical protein
MLSKMPLVPGSEFRKQMLAKFAPDPDPGSEFCKQMLSKMPLVPGSEFRKQMLAKFPEVSLRF